MSDLSKSLRDKLNECLSDRHRKILEDGCEHEEMADIYSTAFDKAERVAEEAISALEKLESEAERGE